MNFGFYLYGIVPHSCVQSLAFEGLDKQPVDSHTIDGFTFLYSDAKQEKYLASRRNLITHEKVLEQAMSEGVHTLLPLRFGLVIKTWETVAEQLIHPHQDKLKSLLAKLTGRQEVSVKVFWDTKSELQGLMEAERDLKQKRDALEGKTMSMDEIIQIGQLIEEGLANRKEIIIHAFQEKLNSLADEVVESEPLTEEMIYNAAYLISWETEPFFCECVTAVDQKFGDRLRIRYNNFTAPYTFAQLT